MSRKGLIWGGVLSLLILVLLLFYFADVLPEMLELSSSPIAPDSRLAQVIAWGITIWSVVAVLLVFLFYWRLGDQFKRLDEKLTIRAEIPGSYALVCIPLVSGIALGLITGLVNWGLCLSCSSLPLLLVLFLLALRARREKV